MALKSGWLQEVLDDCTPEAASLRAWIKFATEDQVDNPDKQWFFRKGFELCWKLFIFGGKK